VFTNKTIYLDHAATTATDKEVLKRMLPFFCEQFGNPSSLYGLGKEAEKALADSRKKIASSIKALPENILFTSGGTESNNLAIFGAAEAYQHKGKHIISVATEHSSVLEPLKKLSKKGFEITFLKTDSTGMIDVEELQKAIRKDTILISVMTVNNEIGTIMPIPEIGREVLKYRKENNTPFPLFHTDACQAANYLEVDVEKFHTDILTLNAGKIYGPKGIGILYVRRGIKIEPQIIGGGQEKELRAGTENVAAIVGMAFALEMAIKNRDKDSKKILELSQYFYKNLKNKISDIKLNGKEFGPDRLPSNINISFKNIEGEALVLYLSEKGIMCSTGSACHAKSLEESHVLTAIGLSKKEAASSIRFTLGKENTKEEIDYVLKYLPAIVSDLREINKINNS